MLQCESKGNFSELAQLDYRDRMKTRQRIYPAIQAWVVCRPMAPDARGISLKRVALIRMVINDPAKVAL